MLNQWHSAHSLCPPLALWRCWVPCSHASLATLPHSCGENKAYTQSVVCDWVEKATRWKWSVPPSQLLGHTKSLSGPSQVRNDEQQAQGVVTYTSHVEAFATGIKNFDRSKSSLIAWSLRSEALDRLILREFKGQNVATPAKYLRKCVDRLI